MNAQDFSVSQLLAMRHSPVRNYVVPGLTSWLIGSPSEYGTIRLFECEREHQECITPHSHRFDFQAWVLKGSVTNHLWRERGASMAHDSDKFLRSILNYHGMGEYDKIEQDVGWWSRYDTKYESGECYSMTSDEVHSINFARDTKVLFFEGRQRETFSTIIEPYISGRVIPTFEVRPWMFEKEGVS